MKASLRYWWAYLWARRSGVGPATSQMYAQHAQELGIAPGRASYALWDSRRIARCYPRILP